MPCDAADDPLAAARARSIAYHGIAELLLPPTDELAEALESGAFAGELEAAAETLGLCHAAAPLLASLGAPPDRQALEHAQMAMFGPSVGVDHPPYSTEYDPGGAYRKEHELADIAGYYRAWGLALDERLHERIDHIGVETDFLAFLSLKEAYELSCDRPERAADVQRHADRFAATYLARAAHTLAERLARSNRRSAFTHAVAMLCALLDARGIPRDGRPRIVSLPVL